MASSVAYLGGDLGGVAQPWRRDMTELLAATGGNIGNLAFWHATRLLFEAEEVHLISRDTRPEAVPASVGVLVIPAANFLNAGADLTRLAALVRALNRPCLVLGLGAQAENEAAPPTLKPGTIDFLREVARLSPSVHVRGAFTQEVCRALGVENTTILGCPSLLINPDLRLGAMIEMRIAALAEGAGPYAVHAACIKPGLQSVERELTRLVLLNPGSSWLVQRPLELMKPIHGEPLSGATEEAYFARCATFLGFPGPPALVEFLRRHGQVPRSVMDWIHSLRRFTAAVNTRIHGTMMGLAAGVPSLCICHDTRTRELAAQMHVPHCAPRDLIEHRYSVPDLFAATAFSGARFDAARGAAAAGHVAALRAVGLRPSRHLLGFLDA